MACFHASTHTYVIHNQIVPQSVTALVKTQFPFNAKAIIDKNYARWKAQQKYASICNDKSDEEGKEAIALAWKTKGIEAANKGTAVHAWAESYININLRWSSPTVPLLQHHEKETEQIKQFIWHAQQKQMIKDAAIVPKYAELIVWWTCNHHVLLAGTIDAIFTDGANYYIVDWKRTQNPIQGARLKQYSLQLSMYSLLLKQTYNIDAKDNLFVVRVHEENDTYEAVKCTDLRNWVNLLLQALA